MLQDRADVQPDLRAIVLLQRVQCVELWLVVREEVAREIMIANKGPDGCSVALWRFTATIAVKPEFKSEFLALVAAPRETLSNEAAIVECLRRRAREEWGANIDDDDDPDSVGYRAGLAVVTLVGSTDGLVERVKALLVELRTGVYLR